MISDLEPLLIYPFKSTFYWNSIDDSDDIRERKRGVKNINSGKKTGIGYQTLSGNGVLAITTGTLKLNGIKF